MNGGFETNSSMDEKLFDSSSDVATIQKLQEEVQLLKKLIVEQHNTLTDLDVELTKRLEQIKYLENELQKHAVAGEEKNTVITTLEDRIHKLSQANDQLKSQLENNHVPKLASLENGSASNQSMEPCFGELAKSLASISQRVGVDVEEEIAEAMVKEHSIMDRTSCMVNALERYAEVFTLAINHSCEVAKVESVDPPNFESEEGSVARLLESIELLGDIINKKEDIIQANHEIMSRIESELMKTKAESKRFQEENSILHSKQNLDSTDKLAKSTDAAKELETYQLKIDSLTAELETTLLKLRDSAKEVESCKHEIETVSNHNAELQNNITEEIALRKQLETRLAAEQQTLSAYRSKVDSYTLSEQRWRSEVFDLRNEITDFKSKVTVFETERTSLQELLDAQRKEGEAREGELQNLQRKLEEMRTEVQLQKLGTVEDIRRELVEAKKENDDLRRRSGKHRVRSPQSTPYSTPKRGDSGQGELTKLFQDFEVIQKQLELERESSARAETIIKQQSQEIDALKKGLISRQSSVESSSAVEDELVPGSKAWHQRQIDRLMKEISNLRQENDELQARVPVVVTQKPENERLVDALETIDKLRLEVASAHSKLQLERMGAARLQEELAEARAELDIDASLREAPVFPAKANLAASVLGDAMNGAGGMGSVFIAERDQLFRDNKKLREKLDQRTREIELVRADVKISEEIRHKASLHNLMEELAAAKARIDELVEMLEKQDSASDQVARVEAERDAYRKEVDDLLGEQKALHRRVVEAEERVGQHVSDMQVLRMSMQSIQQERDAHRLERESMQRRLLESEERLQEMVRTQDNRLLEMADTKMQVERLKLELATAASRSALVEQKMVESQETSSGVISGLLKKVEAMTGQLRDSNLAVAEYEKKESNYQRMTAEFTVMREKLDLAQNRLSALESSTALAANEDIIAWSKRSESLQEELTGVRAELSNASLRAEAAVKRQEFVESQLQERNDEIRQLQGQIRLEKMTATNALASASQIRASELSQISRALQKELVHQTTMMEQKFHVSVVSAEARISRLQRRFFSFVAGIRVQKKERAQTRHLERLLQHNQQELVSNKQANDDAIAAIRELLEWMRSLRYSGAGADYIAVLDTDLTAWMPSGSSPGSSISYNRLPSLIRQARAQLQALIQAQHDIIENTKRTVWEKEVELQDTEERLNISQSMSMSQSFDTEASNARGRYVGTPRGSLPRTPRSSSLQSETPFRVGQELNLGYSRSRPSSSGGVRPGSAGGVRPGSRSGSPVRELRERPRSASSVRAPSASSQTIFQRPAASFVEGTPIRKAPWTPSRGFHDESIQHVDDFAARQHGTDSLYESQIGRDQHSQAAIKEISRIHAELKAERAKLQELQEQHSDLLALLAQQELELNTLRESLMAAAGKEEVDRALARAKRVAKSKYGSYVDFRG